MVPRIVFVLGVFALLIAACGGGDDDGSGSTSPTQASERPTQVVIAPSGPRAEVDPSAGPPGIEVTVRGSGWEPGVRIDVTGRLASGTSADPYETVVAAEDGSFEATFRLETAPDGGELATGRYDLIARTSSTEVVIPFLVETRRPVGNQSPGG